MNGLLNLFYPLLDAFDWSLSFLPAVLRIVVLGALSGALAMGLYVLFSNQARLRACKEEIRAIRTALNAAKDDFAETMRLSRRNLAASFKLLGVTLGPALLSSLPLLAIIGWLAAHYGYVVPAAGTAVPVAFLPTADGIAVEPPEALQGGADGGADDGGWFDGDFGDFGGGFGRQTLRLQFSRRGSALAARENGGRSKGDERKAAAQGGRFHETILWADTDAGAPQLLALIRRTVWLPEG